MAKTVAISENDANQRLDKFLLKKFKTMPQSLMYKYLRKKCIKVNGKHITDGSLTLNNGDVLTLYISDEFFGGKVEEDRFKEVIPELNIVFENSDILIIDKPAGLICHSDANEDFNTLINRIKSYLYISGSYNPADENSFVPSLCNRIDRNTQGLVIAAKNANALRDMNERIKRHLVKKTYLAAIHGEFTRDHGTFRTFIKKDSDTGTVFSSETRISSDYKEAITDYKIIKTKNGLSLAEIELKTGRTHQIRIQFANAGHPLLGDGKYAENRQDRKSGYKFQALCSYSVCFLSGVSDTLTYLDGKEFNVTSDIPFLKLFD